jgi:hypothetical protein
MKLSSAGNSHKIETSAHVNIFNINIVIYATSWKVAGPISDEVNGFFNWPNPSSRTMALGSTNPLTEMSTRNLPEGKGRKVDLTAICEPLV